MDLLKTRDLQQLIRHVSTPLASLYMPTHPTGQDGMQDELRLRKHLDQIEQWLTEEGLRGPVARELVQPARALATNKVFWQHRSQGLAVFLAPDMFRAFRLPERFDELALVGGHFHVRPLVAHESDQRRFLILAFSQKHAHLYEGSPTELKPIEMPGVLQGVEATLNISSVDRGSQVHSGAPVGVGKQAAVFHGHGGEPDTAKSELTTYCRQVNAAMLPFWHDERVPLVVIAVAAVQPAFVEHCSYPGQPPTCVDGNPDHLSTFQLHELAWKGVAPVLDRPRRTALERLHGIVGTDRVSLQISEVLRAAVEGRVDTLFVNRLSHCWGTFDPATLQISVQQKPTHRDDDLLDLALQITLRAGGHVYPSAPDEMPDRAEVAAIYRF